MTSFRQPIASSTFQAIVRWPHVSVRKFSSDTSTFVLDLPYDHLSIFARRYESSEVLVGMPVFVVAELGDVNAPTASSAPITPPEPSGGPDGPKLHLTSSSQFTASNVTQARPKRPKIHVPLGMLSTDHVGYASFDLSPLRSERVVTALHREKVVSDPTTSDGEVQHKKTIGLIHLWVLPFADPVLLVDALAEADVGPNYLTLRHHMDGRRLENRVFNSSSALPSMQNPGILDYRLSPGSFSLPSAVIIGGEGSCESFMPSNLATQTFRFWQIARTPARTIQNPDQIVRGFRLGYLFEYTTEWFPIGHSLGALSYSLPLAPGEVVKIAVVDWSRSDSARRAEETGLSESLVHDTLRDRTLNESVTAMLDEWQRGGSVMGGVAASGGYGGGGMGLGGAASLGGAYTTSSGTRTLTAETSQRVADAFHQSTSAMRELRSTVVVQNLQAEKSNVQTRIVANYNHGHALTMLYYEVLRHYRVVTRLVARPRLALLLDYSARKPDFRNETYLLNFRKEFEALLLDDRVKTGFDALTGMREGRARFADAKRTYEADPKDPGSAIISQLAVTISTGNDGAGGTDGDPYIDLLFTDNSRRWTHQIEPNDTGNPRHLGHPGYDDFEQGDVGTYGLRPQNSFAWRDLRGFVIHLSGGGDWRINHVKLVGSTSFGDQIVLYDADYRQDLPNDTETPEFFTIKPLPGPPAPKIEDFVKAAEMHAAESLMSHLASHSYYYSRFLWLADDVNSRAAQFDNLHLNGRPLLDLIENKALEISGNFVAFPVAAGTGENSPTKTLERAFEWTDGDPANPSDAYIEQLLALPSRGVFAEAKLGHCNANEIIDNTRFWDWQKSPIPFQAPEITGADAGTRSQAPKDLTPTAFPQSLVNIVSPQALPDPAGLSEALKVLGTPNIFRDQSAVQELGTLLGKLSDNATSLASQGLKSRGREDLLENIRSAPELNDDQKKKLVHDLLTKEVGAGTPSQPGGGGASTGPGTETGTSPGTPGTGPGGKTPSTTETGSTGGGGKGPSAPEQGDGTPTSPKPKPKPKPGPGKTKQPDPMPKRGLVFQLNFHRAKVDKTVTGTATITVRPAGTGITHDPNTYVPGVTVGVPTAAQARAFPETWQDQPITDGTLWLASDHSDAPGVITIDFAYDVPLVDRASLITGVFSGQGAPEPDPKTSTLRWSKAKDYAAPRAGNIIVLNITPETKEVPITASDTHSLETALGGEIGASEIISAKVTGSTKNAEGQTTSVTLSMTFLTGGVIMTQDLGQP